MTLEELEKELKSHDWTYQMSDSHSSYMSGKKSEERMRKAAKELGEEGILLYNKYDERYAYPKNPIKY